LKVLIVNTYDSGGAAKACFRLADGLKSNGIDISILLKRNNSATIDAEVLKPLPIPVLQHIKLKILGQLVKLRLIDKSKLLSKEDQFTRERPEGLELFTFPDSAFDITTSDSYKDADIINFHWVSDFLDYSSFFSKNTKPVVWTLHDMNPFSGGEHYEEEYIGIDENGFPKKRVLTQKEREVFKSVKALKMKSLHKVHNLTLVSPSQWLGDICKASDVFKDLQVKCIPNSLNTDIYNLMGKNEAREFLNIPLDKKVILFVAESLTNHRKGFVFLKRAVEYIDNSDVVISVVGKNKANLNFENIIELGMIKDEVKMSMAYAAADVFVIPSLMDNLPNTVVESLCCGTPVIGFPIGGIPDMIVNGENGLLTSEISVKALVKTLEEFLSHIEDYDRETIHKEAIKKYSLNVQANAYIDLFNTILVNED
tara:strand:+ start:1442 stop:2716 length:1275 start_codon:yes stop_codon:yes gene_type:complete